ncbi:MAG: DUF1553 domain-containing protein [Planctomycetes bacterium]|nr:DUF1553 domain-containing protein [Planctomycetota bacterium]
MANVATAVARMLLAATLQAAQNEPSGSIEYNRDVRPILAETCFPCHGPDSASREADLRLDQRDPAIESGAIVPRSPEESGLIERIFATDADEVMPPPDSRKALTPEQKDLLKRWIEQGAEYQLHWSLIPPSRPDPPPVRNAAWVRNPIDAFVLARMEAAGLPPAPEADRRTIARRLSLDLTGLPPDPSLVEAFVSDAAPGAYETFVDRLLALPAWGEHRARYWLDYARYADSHGIHFDNYREIWPYRDWVIQAFNANMPYDRFTIENLAGDLLPDATLDQRIGSGFHRCNITTNEGGVIPEEYAVLYTRDRTETTAQVWLGMTANCAVCHDHKFDPISTREFYELSAFFNNTTQNPMDGNIKDTPPIVVVPSSEDRARWDGLPSAIADARRRVDERRVAATGEFATWAASSDVEDVRRSIPVEGLHWRAALDEGTGRTVHVAVDGAPSEVGLADSAEWTDGPGGTRAVRVQGAAFESPAAADFERDQPFTCAAWVHLPANDSSGAVCARMDAGQTHRGWDFWTQRRQVGMHLIHAWPDDALKVVGKAQIPANQWTHVAVAYDGSAKAAGVRIYYDGKHQETLVEADKLANTTRIEVPFKIGQRHGSEPLSGAGIQDLRVYRRALDAAEIETLARHSHIVSILAKATQARSRTENDTLYAWWLGARDAPYRDATAAVDGLLGEQKAIQARSPVTHVMAEKAEPPKAYVLARGDYDKRKDEVAAETPDVLPPFPADFPKNRLGLARWLLLPEQPLTARVTVNRFWLEVFGTGLVRTAGDFGVAGELPSHPELLDWLAVEFRESGWDVKKLLKTMVLSATYRQSALATEEKIARDPDNRLWSRGPRFRMDAEMVRDYALSASGLLARRIGGPSVKPYQPPGVWEAVAMIGSNTRDYRRDSGENLYRRSLYTFWKRSAPPASLETFNAPSREACVVRRERTNTPLQALATLNDEQYVEAARHLAQRALQQGDMAIDDRIQFLAARLLARPLDSGELAVVRDSAEWLAAHYAAHADDATRVIAVGESKADPAIAPGQLAAWTMVANALLNLDEVLTK